MNDEEGITLWEYMLKKNDYSQTYSNAKESEPITYTHGRMRPCPYCGSDDIRTYADGTAECDSCGKEYRYAY